MRMQNMHLLKQNANRAKACRRAHAKMYRSTRTERKQSIKACKHSAGMRMLTCRHLLNQNASTAKAWNCMHALACPCLSAGVIMPEKYLHTRVRAECTAAGANNHYRMVASNDVDDTM